MTWSILARLTRAMLIGLFAVEMNRLGGRGMLVCEWRQSLTIGTMEQTSVRRSLSLSIDMIRTWYAIDWCEHRLIVVMVPMNIKCGVSLLCRGKALSACRLTVKLLHCNLKRVRVMIRGVWV